MNNELKITSLYHLNVLLIICLLNDVGFSTELVTVNATFYEAVKKHFDNEPPLDSTMFAPGNASEVDVQGSLAFIKEVLSMDNPPGTKRALDVGAGIGRVSKNVLIHFFDQIDLVEQNARYGNIALNAIGTDNHEKLGLLYRTALQNFNPDMKYDVIWIDGVLMYLGDEDVISLLLRCRAALKTNSVIVVKETLHVPKTLFVFRSVESVGIHRSKRHYIDIFHAAALKLIKLRDQEGLPNNVVSVCMYALVPADGSDDWYEAFNASSTQTLISCFYMMILAFQIVYIFN